MASSSAVDTPAMAQRRAAVFSVYIHARYPQVAAVNLLPSHCRPMPLEQALDVVRGQGAEPERGLLVQRRVASAVVRSRLERTDPFDGLVAELTGPLKPRDPNEFLAEDRSVKEQVYATVADRWTKGHLSVQQPPARFDVRFDGGTLVTSSIITIQVAQPFERLIRFLDPRGWDECSDYFRETFQVVRSGSRWESATPDRAEELSHLGEDWEGVLFEHFVNNWNQNELSYFKNLLSVTQRLEAPQPSASQQPSKDPPRRRWKVQYRLLRSLESKTLFLPRAGGIDVDSGYIEVEGEDEEGNCTVTATKSIRFTDDTPRSTYPRGPWDIGLLSNYTAPAVLQAWSEQSISDLVCCRAAHEDGESSASAV